MNIKSVLGTLVGALLCAGVWAGISITTEYEIGLIAWGIGGFIGFCSASLSGRGKANGILCAVLAITSIFGGKLFANNWMIEEYISEYIAEEVGAEGYENMKSEASLFVTLRKDEYPEFMLEYGYTRATDITDITPEEINNFHDLVIPYILEFHEDTPSYEEWHKAEVAEIRFIIDEISITELVVADLSMVDFIFGFLSIATAFSIGGKVPTKDEEKDVDPLPHNS